MMRALDPLIDALPAATRHNWRPLEIGKITTDSRQVEPGDLFVAVPGVSVDGHRFIPAALKAGAVACIVERLTPELEGEYTVCTPAVQVPNAREALAHLMAAWHGNPGRKLRVIGVTGTDGKTTTVRLIAGILSAAGHVVGTIDSVGASIAGRETPTGFHTTTPDAPEVQAYLAEMVEAGVEYVVIESTSHGLAQHRVTAVEYDVAAVTNITHEHLDFHGSLAAYQQAKAMLFHALSTSVRKDGVPKVAVLNRDDASYAYLSPIPAECQLSYGLDAVADLHAQDVAVSPSGLHLEIVTPQGPLAMSSPLVGHFNVFNILAAVSVAYSQGIAPEAIAAGIAQVRGIVGRMERIDRGQPFTAIVDFAHTPNAMDKALQCARELTEGQVIVVFGCAGLRDVAKRAWMGEVAGRLADRVIITAEDPRTEPLDAIMDQIAVGCQQAGRQQGEGYYKIGDRGEAILTALEMARPGDVVIATGKGHERSMCFGEIEHPWSDQDAVRDGLAGLGYANDADPAP